MPANTAPKAPPAQRPLSGSPMGSGVIDEQTAIARFERLKKLVAFETWIIAALGLIVILVLPFAQPVYLYYALNPDKKVMKLVGLDMPNMTNRAILSWATTSTTEIMTMGFGDMDVKLPKQRVRFTKEGWAAYVKSFVNQKVGQTFKQNQLVLTTVPSNTPVIVGQGINSDQAYQWIVQMPVIMTYGTNNNVQRQTHSIITLRIVRVPAEDSPAGVAIKSWASSN